MNAALRFSRSDFAVLLCILAVARSTVHRATAFRGPSALPPLFSHLVLNQVKTQPKLQSCILESLTACNAQLPTGGMLKVITTETREATSLDGFWRFKADPSNQGFSNNWMNGLPEPTILMPVPSSFNDIGTDPTLRDYIGWVWYERFFDLPTTWVNANRRAVLRFESVHYNAQADLSHLVNSGPVSGPVRVVVAVNNTLDQNTLPPGDIIIYNGSDHMHPPGYTVQVTHFDFFNYAGIDRQVRLYSTPSTWIDDITLTFSNAQPSNAAIVNYVISVLPKLPPSGGTVSILDANGQVVSTSPTVGTGAFQISSPRWWTPETPYLYTLKVSIGPTNQSTDVYRLPFGIRTIAVTNKAFLLNGKPFYFNGVDKHEDTDIRGKGIDYPTLVRDFNLLKWLGVRAVRTSHYPYAHEFYDLADQLGIAVIDECTAVGVRENRYYNPVTLQHHKQVMAEIIRRDKNHPSVLMWSIANEPDTTQPNARNYFQQVTTFTRGADPTKRPLILVNSDDYPVDNGCSDFVDVVGVNRYYGWYSDPGALSLIQRQLTYDFDGWYSKYNKSILCTEYGADTVSGLHQTPSVMFSEEFQLDFMAQYWAVFDKLRSDYLIGELVWNFADFATGQSTIRVGSKNLKGLLSRQRQPKMIAHFLKRRYEDLDK